MMRDRKPRVIIIDENRAIRELYGLELADNGYEVVMVGDTAAVDEAIGSFKPDLVILDPWIGGKYRWDLLSGIKQAHSSIPVILCLAFGAPVPFHAPFPKDLFPAESFVVKSMRIEDLLLKVGQIIQGSGEGK